MVSRVTFPPKSVDETKIYPFEFESELGEGETISSATVAATVYSGIDVSPSSMISGAADVSGSVVEQEVIGGVAGVQYLLTCAAVTSLSQVLIVRGHLAVLS